MHVKYAQEDADPLSGPSGVVIRGGLGNQPVSAKQSTGACRNRPLWIAKEPQEKRRQQHGHYAPRPNCPWPTRVPTATASKLNP